MVRRVANALLATAVRAGVTPANLVLLTVGGRKSGKKYTTPVNVVRHGGARYLVSPYGDRTWTKNARATGKVELRRGRKVEFARVEEIPPETAAAVLRKYWHENPITRPYFDVGADPSEEDFWAVLEHDSRRHPVFLIFDAVS